MGETKYCKHCGEIIDAECVVCPKCGKQVEELKSKIEPNIIINNNNNNINNNTNNNNTATVIGREYSSNTSPKSKLIALILCIFFGYFGVHRFYVGKIGTGIIWLFTCGLFCFGWIYDIIKIASGTFIDGAGRVISN